MLDKRIKALIVAILFGVLLGVIVTHAQEPDDDEIVVYYPGICAFLEPYSTLWYVLHCDLESELVAETVTYDFRRDGRVFVDVRREFRNGLRVHVVREIGERK